MALLRNEFKNWHRLGERPEPDLLATSNPVTAVTNKLGHAEITFKAASGDAITFLLTQEARAKLFAQLDWRDVPSFNLWLAEYYYIYRSETGKRPDEVHLNMHELRECYNNLVAPMDAYRQIDGENENQ